MQALQGLPGYRGTENGIGIGLGLQQLAQARAQAELSAQQAALAGLRGLQTGYPGDISGLHQPDQSVPGISLLPLDSMHIALGLVALRNTYMADKSCSLHQLRQVM